MKTTVMLLAATLCGAPFFASAQTQFQPMEDVNHVVDLTLDSLEKANTVRPLAGSSRQGNEPVLFLVGNSTMRTGTKGNGDNGQWGWGYFAHNYFKGLSVENQALGGTSSRTYYKQLWPAVKKGIRPGDFVIIELGHNDNGPFDSGRARASIRGISATDSLVVTIKETGRQDTVYSYGEYLRRFVRETKALGATPILFSLTPRNAWEKDDTTRIVRVNKTFGLWAKQIAEEQDVPFIDLNDISARKFEGYSHFKVDYHFYLDHIHSSEFGAKMNARSAYEGLSSCQHPAIHRLQQYLTAEPLTGRFNTVKREKGKPVVFITGDSTVKNEDRDENGMWGWGSQASTIFNTQKITPINCAKAGRSTRTYLEEGRWDEVYNNIQPGDFVLIQFGHNDIGDIDKGKARGVIATANDTSHVYRVRTDKAVRNEVIYSFGWYLKKFIDDVREKGGTPLLVSLTPRNEWPGGKVERRNNTYGEWYRQVARETGVDLIDVHNITADALDKMGQEKAKAYYNHDHTHTSLLGAKLNAKSVAKGIKKVKSPLRKYLK